MCNHCADLHPILIQSRQIFARYFDPPRSKISMAARSTKLPSVWWDHHLKQYCRITQANRNLLTVASKQHPLSPRACYRILRVARTLAVLDSADAVCVAHLAEVISYRSGTSRVDPLY